MSVVIFVEVFPRKGETVRGGFLLKCAVGEWPVWTSGEVAYNKEPLVSFHPGEGRHNRGDGIHLRQKRK